MTAGLRPPLADPQADAPVCWCGHCNGEVYTGECVFRWEKQKLCADCFKNAVTAWLEESPLQVAGELSVEWEVK